MLTRANTLPEALHIRRDVTTILKSGGFELRKIASNDKRLLPKVECNADQKISLDMQSTTKMLGIHWIPTKDTIHFSVNIESFTNKTTKREILSNISKVFDPLGIANPITVVAKIILQKAWRLQLGWDDHVPEHIHLQWSKFLKTFSNLNHISIPRNTVNIFPYNTLELHGFCDSSKRAYGACIYIRVVNNQNVACNLLCSSQTIINTKT